MENAKKRKASTSLSPPSKRSQAPIDEEANRVENIDVESIECKVCESGDDEMSLLLCDSCNAGYHMRCLVTPLLELPQGDWYCPECVDQVSKMERNEPEVNMDGPELNMISTDVPVENQSSNVSPVQEMERENDYEDAAKDISPSELSNGSPKGWLVWPLTRLPHIEPMPRLKLTRSVYEVSPSRTLECINWSEFEVELKAIEPVRRPMFKPVLQSVLSALGISTPGNHQDTNDPYKVNNPNNVHMNNPNNDPYKMNNPNNVHMNNPNNGHMNYDMEKVQQKIHQEQLDMMNGDINQEKAVKNSKGRDTGEEENEQELIILETERREVEMRDEQKEESNEEENSR